MENSETFNETNLNEPKPKNYAVVLQIQPNTDVNNNFRTTHQSNNELITPDYLCFSILNLLLCGMFLGIVFITLIYKICIYKSPKNLWQIIFCLNIFIYLLNIFYEGLSARLFSLITRNNKYNNLSLAKENSLMAFKLNRHISNQLGIWSTLFAILINLPAN